MCYQLNLEYLVDPNSSKEKLITKYPYYLSNNIEHDTLFVQH